jgi:hypothetical protein
MSTETAIETQPPEVTPAPERKKSGYRRLQARHRTLITEHEALKSDYEQQQIEVEALQKDIEKLLEQHRRLMQTVKAPSRPTPWFEGANLTLTELAASPDPRAVQVFVQALAQLQSRISPIVARTPIA